MKAILELRELPLRRDSLRPLADVRMRCSMQEMRAPFGFMAAAIIGALVSSPASALCSYNGVDDARTTIAQEFADARWVVRARVLSAKDGTVERGKPDEGMEWTLYRVAVVRTFKGSSPRRIRFFTERNSGGFYMDRAWVPLPKGHDIGGEYLLFLNPITAYRGRPNAAAGAAFVNYSCGQSRVWSSVPTSSRQLLMRLARRGDVRLPPKTDVGPAVPPYS